MAITDSLISSWGLEEASGSRADRYGTNTLTDNNTVTQAAGKLGNAGQFTRANNEWLSLADNASVSMGAGVRCTIAGWIYNDSLPAAVNLYYIGKIDIGAVPSKMDYVIYRVTSPDRFQFLVSSDGNVAGSVGVTEPTTLATATWYFVIATYDGTNITIRMNNGSRVTAAFSADIFDGTIGFALGGDSLNRDRDHDGRLDEMALWKRALSDQEELLLYNGGNGLPWPWWTPQTTLMGVG